MTEEELQERLRVQRREDLLTLMDLPAGRRVIFALIDETGAFDDSFTGNSASYYKDGRKSVGLELFKQVMALDPGRFTQMWQEHETALAEAEAKLNEHED